LVDASATTPEHAAPFTAFFSLPIAASRFFLLRPFRITRAPSRVNASAMAKPIPELEPVTSARRPAILRSTSWLRWMTLAIDPFQFLVRDVSDITRRQRCCQVLDPTLTADE